MSLIDTLVDNYERFVKIPWDTTLAAPEKVWFVVYDPDQERRLRLRISDFQMATTRARHGWHFVDLTDTFAQWMAANEYRDAYFEQPEDMELALQDFATFVAEKVITELEAPSVNDTTVVAIAGVASMFGLASVSAMIDSVAPHIRGRLLVFFPGHTEGSIFRILDARDGWNYMAIVISANTDR
jgi:hypothetical protein